MIGLIPKILIDLVRETAGDDGVAQLQRLARDEGDANFRLDTVYPAARVMQLLGATMKMLDLPRAEVIAIYARAFTRDVHARFPAWFEMAQNSREILELQPTIHNCFATGLRSKDERRAVSDKFRIERRGEDLVTFYASPNQLCDLYLALSQEMALIYGDELVQTQTLCMHRGDETCEIHTHWTRFAENPGVKKSAVAHAAAPVDT